MKKILALILVVALTLNFMAIELDVADKPINSIEEQEVRNTIPSFTPLADATKEEMGVLNSKDLYAKSAVLIDGDSGRVLYGKNEEEVLPMASTTKIMTLILALEKGNLDDVVSVSKYASTMPDVQLNIMENENYYLRDLLYSLILNSHNDSAVAIAEHIGGGVKEFAQMMNDKAKEIGCKNTFFITPNGLDAKVTLDNQNNQNPNRIHSTTAKELALIMKYCVMESPLKEEFRKITATDTHTFSNLVKGEDGAYRPGTRSFTCTNHNAFLHLMSGAFSGKTGFTAAAGYCYVGALEREGKTFIVALLACGWPNNKSYKWSDTKKLMNYGLENWETHSLDQVPVDLKKVGEIPVINSEVDFYSKVSKIPLSYEKITDGRTLLLNKDEKVEIDYVIPKHIKAPVKKGQLVGKLRYKVGDTVIRECKVTTNKDMGVMNYSCCIRHIIEKLLLQ